MAKTTANKHRDDDYLRNYFDYGVHIPQRTIYCDKDVDAVFAEYVIKGLNVLESISQTDPIRIILNNSGGEEYDGLAVYDYIKRVATHCNVIIDVYGSCFSMAAWILQAATTRRMSPNSRLMIHLGENGLSSNHPRINSNWMEFWKKEEVMFEDILLDKIHLVQPKFPRSRLRKMLDFDTILTAHDAVKLGLADGLV